jgi:TRAP-type C4-dicarboxylate transport system permease small subunit
MARIVEDLIGKVLNAVALLAGSLLFCIALIVTTDVLKRWITGKPILGVFEAVEVLLVAVTMGVLGLVEWQQRQLNVDVFTHRAQGRWALFFLIIDKFFAALFVGVLVSMASLEWLKAWNGWYLRRGMVEIPIVIPMGFLLFGAFLTLVAAVWGLMKAVSCFWSGRVYEVPMTDGRIGHVNSGVAMRDSGSH